jgi:ribonuclease-3
MGCDRFLLLGKGLSSHEKVPASITSAVLESLIAGVYLDGGIEAARTLIERILEPELEMAAELEHGRNYKSLLQQHAQKSFGETPIYKLLDEKGPDHSKCFKVAAIIGAQSYTAAWGPNKKEAEQRAAQNALHELQGKELPYASD